ncbi:hypothetical protein pb186bvf_020000 [Paramecium bursaria]
MEHVYSLEKIIKPQGDVDYIINRELRQEKQKVEFQSHARQSYHIFVCLNSEEAKAQHSEEAIQFQFMSLQLPILI